MSTVISRFLVTCPYQIQKRGTDLNQPKSSQGNKTNCFSRDHTLSVYCRISVKKPLLGTIGRFIEIPAKMLRAVQFSVYQVQTAACGEQVENF